MTITGGGQRKTQELAQAGVAADKLVNVDINALEKANVAFMEHKAATAVQHPAVVEAERLVGKKSMLDEQISAFANHHAQRCVGIKVAATETGLEKGQSPFKGRRPNQLQRLATFGVGRNDGSLRHQMGGQCPVIVHLQVEPPPHETK